jgi:hypothetical protein
MFMERIERERIKALIELSSTVEEADEVIFERVGLKTIEEKLAFLSGMFDSIETLDSTCSKELLYKLWLENIIYEKWT